MSTVIAWWSVPHGCASCFLLPFGIEKADLNDWSFSFLGCWKVSVAVLQQLQLCSFWINNVSAMKQWIVLKFDMTMYISAHIHTQSHVWMCSDQKMCVPWSDFEQRSLTCICTHTLLFLIFSVSLFCILKLNKKDASLIIFILLKGSTFLLDTVVYVSLFFITDRNPF